MIYRILILIMGVFLPFICVFVELTTRMCSNAFMNPLPHLGYVCAYLYISVSTIYFLSCMRKIHAGKEISLKRAFILLGINSIFSLYFSIFFLPLLPLSFIAILILGLGLCSLSPFISSIISLYIFYNFKKYAKSIDFISVKRYMFYGLFLGCFFVIGLELYEFSYRYIANAALDSKLRYHQESLSIFRIGLFRERIVINPELNYRDSIGILPKFIRIRRGLHFDTEELYFRVTGELRKSAILNDYLEHSPSSFDIHQGDDVVGDIQEDLYMKESILNASIDGKSALSYSEWTMVFSNESYLNQEARAEILLPPGSVVTRLTLWVEGEEREAAFASRGKTSGAYKEIVAQQRDPVLVTTRGRDRVFVQCFPVLPKQSMKIRFGYTTPLVLDRSKQGHYIEPKILDRNFKYKGLNIHEVWLESDANFISRNEDFKVILRDGVYVYHEKFESDYFDNEPNSFDV